MVTTATRPTNLPTLLSWARGKVSNQLGPSTALSASRSAKSKFTQQAEDYGFTTSQYRALHGDLRWWRVTRSEDAERLQGTRTIFGNDEPHARELLIHHTKELRTDVIELPLRDAGISYLDHVSVRSMMKALEKNNAEDFEDSLIDLFSRHDSVYYRLDWLLEDLMDCDSENICALVKRVMFKVNPESLIAEEDDLLLSHLYTEFGNLHALQALAHMAFTDPGVLRYFHGMEMHNEHDYRFASRILRQADRSLFADDEEALAALDRFGQQGVTAELVS